MACAAVDVELANLTGTFDLDSVVAFNLVNIGRYIINNFENVYNFCCQLKLLNNFRKCPRCRRDLKLSVDRRADHTTPISFRCTNRNCQKDYISIREGTFFEKSHLTLEQIILLSNLFCGKITGYDQIRHECQLSESQLSFSSIADWLSFCREVCLETVARETPKLIGGAGLTVEIDESKFGKRKYNKR